MTDKVSTFQITLKQTYDEKEVYIHASARMVPASIAPDINQQYIENLLDSNGYGRYKINSEKIEEVVAALNAQLEDIVAEVQAEGISFDTDTIAYAVDADAFVTIPSDKLTAKLTIKTAKGGAHLSKEHASKLLEEAGVTYGIDEKVIDDLLAESQATEAEEVSADVAFAKLPVDGEDAKFETLVDTAAERVLKPRLRDDGTVDMRDLGDVPTVKAGEKLMRKHPPTDGEKGIDVTWGLLAPNKGIDKSLKASRGSEVSEDDPELLIAAIAGQPNLSDNSMTVDDAVKVNAVDISTGNMVLDANLIVKGDIDEGLKVRCEGDLTVGGVIQSADVQVKGNIIVGGGIIGRPHYEGKEHNYSCRVECEGNMNAMYANYAQLAVKGDLNIAEQLYHSDTTVQGNIKVGNQKTVGAQIVGGVTRCNQEIATDVVGASAGVKTVLDLSGRLGLKQMEIACIRSVLEARNRMEDTMLDALSKFSKLPSTPARKEHIVKIKNTANHIRAQIEKDQGLEERLKSELVELSGDARVRAKTKFHPSVTLRVGHHSYVTSRPREAGYLVFEDNEIQYRSDIMKD